MGAEKRTHSNHLDMALLEPALDAVEISGVEVVAVVGLLHDIVVDGALFEGAGPIRLLLRVAFLGHCDGDFRRASGWGRLG